MHVSIYQILQFNPCSHHLFVVSHVPKFSASIAKFVLGQIVWVNASPHVDGAINDAHYGSSNSTPSTAFQVTLFRFFSHEA